MYVSPFRFGSSRRTRHRSSSPCAATSTSNCSFRRRILWAIAWKVVVSYSIVKAGLPPPYTGSMSNNNHTSISHPVVDKLHLQWEDITYRIGTRINGRAHGRRDNILKDVSGEARPGRLLAIMGPSGCGKSSLLNALSGRVIAAGDAELTGTVEICGIPLRSFDIQRYMAYVRQEQDFYPFLTVKETLLIAAGMRLDRRVKAPERERTVCEIMDKLELTGAADSLVGDIRNPGISGGEKRRLGLGTQLIGLETPSLIFLDEPTSGLDSHQALQVMSTIRDLCLEGHTVVVSIHQPRSSIYALFDDILLLSEGTVMYHGPRDKALSRLASVGYKCPRNFNPADFMVDLISPVAQEKSEGIIVTGRGHGQYDKQDGPDVLVRLAEAARDDWKSRCRGSEMAAQRKPSSEDDDEEGMSLISHDHGKSRGRQGGSETSGSFHILPGLRSGRHVSESRRKCGWGRQFGLLLMRSWRQASRDKFAVVARVALGFGLGGVFGSIFWQMNHRESSIRNRVSLFANVAINTAMFACVRALQTLATEKPVITRERDDQGYSASAYLMSKIIAELPTETVFPLIFGSTVYYAAGLNKPLGGIKKLAKFLGMLLIQAHASSALGLMVGCISPSMDVANLLGPAIIVVFLLLGGVHDDIPKYLKRLESISSMKWGIQGLVTNEMRGMKFTKDRRRIPFLWRSGTKEETVDGERVMEAMGIEEQDLWQPTRRLLSLTAVFHSATLINLFLSTPSFQTLQDNSSTKAGALSERDTLENSAHDG